MEEKREMNLFELIIICCKWIKSLYKSTINLFFQTIRLSLQYFWIVGLVVAIFISAAFYFTMSERRIYQSNTMITFSKEIKPMVINELLAINAMHGNDFAKFAELMNISQKQAKHFSEICYYQVIDFLNDSIADMIDFKHKIKLSDTINRCMPDRLGIRIYLKGDNDFTPFYQGLSNFFNKNKNIVRVDSASKAMLAERIAFCNKELERLDKFSDYDYFEGSERNIVRLNNYSLRIESSRKQLYYIDMRDLLREKNYLTNLAVSNSNVINYISENPNVDVYSRWKFMIFFVFFGYIFGLIFALIVKRRKQIWNYLKDNDY